MALNKKSKHKCQLHKFVGSEARPTQPSALLDTAHAPTRKIHPRQYQWALAFVYLFRSSFWVLLIILANWNHLFQKGHTPFAFQSISPKPVVMRAKTSIHQQNLQIGQ